MEHRFYGINRELVSVHVLEITAAEAQTISNHIVWEVAPDLFPLKDDQEIKKYFLELYLHPEKTKLLPGFDTIKTT